MLGAISQAVSGIDAGFDRLDKAATRIARDGAEGDLVGNILELTRASHDVRINLAVLRTANEMIGSLIDTYA